MRVSVAHSPPGYHYVTLLHPRPPPPLHTHTRVYTHTHIHTRTHTNTHTHTQASARPVQGYSGRKRHSSTNFVRKMFFYDQLHTPPRFPHNTYSRPYSHSTHAHPCRHVRGYCGVSPSLRVRDPPPPTHTLTHTTGNLGQPSLNTTEMGVDTPHCNLRLLTVPGRCAAPACVVRLFARTPHRCITMRPPLAVVRYTQMYRCICFPHANLPKPIHTTPPPTPHTTRQAGTQRHSWTAVSGKSLSASLPQRSRSGSGFHDRSGRLAL